MARVKINIPDNYIFKTVIVLRISDINYGGHLANDSVLSIAHEARMRFFKNFGYSEKDVEGVGIIMADAAIVYKSQGFYGDKLTIKISVGDFSRSGFDMFYLIQNQEDKEVARIKTNLVFFDYDANKVAAIPDEFLKKVS